MSKLNWMAGRHRAFAGDGVGATRDGHAIRLDLDHDSVAWMDDDTATALLQALVTQLACRAPTATEFGFAAATTPADRALATRLLELTRTLPTIGFERSIKLRPHAADEDRFLVGIDPTAWAAQVGPRGIRDTLAGLAMPAALLDEYLDRLPGAVMTALSFEPGGVLKAYLDLARADDDTAFIGFKWHPHGPGSAVVTRYRAAPAAPLSAVIDRLRAVLPAPAGPALRLALEAWLTEVSDHAPADTWTWLDVDEGPTGGRRSFDLNLYPAGLRLAAVAPHWQAIACALDSDASAASRFAEQMGDAIVGHLSAGTGRTGDAFLTLYVEPPVV